MPNENKETIKTNNPIKFNIFIPITILLSLVILGGSGYYFYNKLIDRDTITVTGKATEDITNQVAKFSITIQEFDSDKSVAVNKASEKSKEVVNIAKESGISDKDLQTTNLNVYQREEPYIDSGVTKYKPMDWYASYTVEITLRDITKSEDMTSKFANIENTSMWGPQLQVDYESVDEEAILNKAVEDARSKAESLAKASNKRLGKVISIDEGSSDYRGDMVYSVKEGMGGGGFPVEPGSSKVTKTVIVTFELR